VAVYRSFANQIGLVITDINMPMMDGIQAMLRIRMTRPNAKFICMTGAPEQHNVEGEVLFTKPFSVERLLSSLDELLRPSMTTPSTNACYV
jgi:YesN/AraC family two-component response regulator